MTFSQVYEIVKKIPRGRVATYGQIAMVLGEPRNARVVGWALHINQDPQVPCHRVVDRNGQLAANFAHGGQRKQRQFLEEEEVLFLDSEKVDLKRCLVNLDHKSDA